MAKKVRSQNKFVQAAVAGILMLEGAGLAHASDVPPKAPKAWEKCYGVAKAGLNDCSSLDNKHLCSGGSEIDGDPLEYVWVPKNTCDKLVNGVRHEAKRYRIKNECQTSGTKNSGNKITRK